MNEQRRSRRHISTCPSVSNPFSSNQPNSALTTIIPKHIMSVINSQQSISCDFIDRLQTFSMKSREQIELKAVFEATEYQMEWQKHVACADSIEVLNRVRDYQIDDWRRRESNIWQDAEFLEKLNDFIMGKTTTSIEPDLLLKE